MIFAFLLLISPVAGALTAPELVIETLVSPEDPYVQSRVRYTVKMYRGSHLLQGDVIAPEMEHWLPAFDLTLREEWTTPDPPWRVGEQLERRIVIEAVGLTGAQLPVLAPPELEGMQQLRARVRSGTEFRAGEAYGRRVERYLYIVSKPGEYQLSALEIPWWNLGNGTEQKAVLPGRKLVILPVSSPSITTDAPSYSPGVEPTPVKVPAVVRPSCKVEVYQWGILFGFLVGLLPIWRWLRRRTSPEALKGERCRRNLQSFDRACRMNDAAAAGIALLGWGKSCWGQKAPGSLGGLARLLNHQQAAGALWELDKLLYGGEKITWNGDLAAKRIRSALRYPPRKAARTGKSVLPCLE